MSVNTYMSDLASTLVLSESEKGSINTSLDTIKSRLTSYFSDITEKKTFGSFPRVTILPRKADSNSDIDLMVVFSNPNAYLPQSFLNRLKTFAEYYYHSSEIYQSSPTIVLELNHIKFELVPAYREYGSYYIPQGSSVWQYTDPDGFSASLLECNKNNNYRIKPIIRLLKHWNIEKNSRNMASFELEKKIAEEMKYSYFSCTSYTDYAQKAFETIKYCTSYSRVDTALGYIRKALEYENNSMPNSALLEIKKVFPGI